VPFLSGNVATGPHLLPLKDAKEPFEHYLVYCKGTAPFLITTALPADTFFFFSWNGEEILHSLSSNPFFFSFTICVVIPFILQQRTVKLMPELYLISVFYLVSK